MGNCILRGIGCFPRLVEVEGGLKVAGWMNGSREVLSIGMTKTRVYLESTSVDL